MQVQVEFWNLVLLLLAFFAACAVAGQVMLSLHQRHLDDKFEAMESARQESHLQLARRLEVSEKDRQESHLQLAQRLDGIEATNREEAKQWHRVERELLELKSELPLHYVRREDQVRRDSIVEAKLDGLATKFENAVLRMQVNGGQRATN